MDLLSLHMRAQEAMTPFELKPLPSADEFMGKFVQEKLKYQAAEQEILNSGATPEEKLTAIEAIPMGELFPRPSEMDTLAKVFGRHQIDAIGGSVPKPKSTLRVVAKPLIAQGKFLARVGKATVHRAIAVKKKLTSSAPAIGNRSAEGSKAVARDLSRLQARLFPHPADVNL